MKKVIIKVKPETYRDDDGIYTIFDGNNKGGAIMSSNDPFEAMRKFKEATHLAYAVRTLIEMKNNGKIFYIPEFI